MARRSYQHPHIESVTLMTVTLLCSGSEEWALRVEAIPGTDISKWQKLAESATRAVGLEIVEIKSYTNTAPSQATSCSNVYAVPARNADGSPSPEPSSPISLRQAENLVAELFPADKPIRAYSSHKPTLQRHSPGYPPNPEFQLRTPPVRRSELSSHELVQLARGLRTMRWSWLMDDLLGLGEVADDWIVVESEPDRITIDTQAVHGYCYIEGREGLAEAISYPVATISADESYRTPPSEMFNRMAAALSNVYGAATTDSSNNDQHCDWAGSENTLRLLHQPPHIWLVLQLNKRRGRLDYSPDPRWRTQ
ncbi:DUF6301 family protein [Nocardia sp. CA-290969]|uniref:DUF6301 family protein n=1 Tax=Nocardia sp. CA-290969 TaxID=3239986 RepID=UPI003D92FF2F